MNGQRINRIIRIIIDYRHKKTDNNHEAES